MADELEQSNDLVSDLFTSFEPSGLGDESGTNTTQAGESSSAPAPATTQTPATPAAPAAAPRTSPATKPATQAEPLPVVQSTSLTPQQIAELAANAAKGVIEAGKTPEVPKEPTQEDVDKQFAVVRPTEEQLSAIFRGGPDGVKAFTEALHGAANMGANVAAHHAVKEINRLHEWTKNQLAQLSGSLAPAREVAEAQQLEQHTNAFFQAHPHWTAEDKPLLKAVHDSLLKQGFKGTAQEVFNKINEEGVTLKRYVVPNFGMPSGAPTGTSGNPGTVPTNGASKPALPPSRMTPTPQGGTGGTSGGSGSSTDKSGPQAVFE